MQGGIGIAERAGWGTRAKRRSRRGGRGGDDDGPRRVGSNLLALARSRPDRMDPGDWSPSLHHHILLATQYPLSLSFTICSTCSLRLQIISKSLLPLSDHSILSLSTLYICFTDVCGLPLGFQDLLCKFTLGFSFIFFCFDYV